MSGYKPIGDSKPPPSYKEDSRNAVTSYQNETTPTKDEEGGGVEANFPSLYTAPFDLSTSTSFGDRLKLIWESARPWGEFFDFTMFSLPKPAELKERVIHNSEVYFSNYAIAAALYMLFKFFIRPVGVVALVVSLLLASWFYGTNASSITIKDPLVITPVGKHIVMAVVVLLAVAFCHVLGALLGLFWFSLIFVGIHLLVMTPSRTTI
eukprot:Plantae.Rhodophyta-Purpureofilum_apyrenoidigerum.ctg9071.p1 GENE.Plantae.Rhodophyta-Purpureofilum_apyrenoidigerum.ctg9071~~Plantae.Rhodophyta-Purpureofilum_apyrenoidigerum.ctg9071.p1  ORF type:complete len:208 (+),score=33.12 Plantae.Rhodophyta-Purpureofilum_apyrenoidigerum.ctg9071:149-772(+)